MNPIETYIRNLYEIYSIGAGVKETSYYSALENLFNEIGKTLKPSVRCVINLRNQGAGIPDGGLFTAHQFSKSKAQEKTPFETIFPERGVIEIQSIQEDVTKIAKSEQVKKYWQRYRQILVTNYRDFLLLGEDNQGEMLELERFTLVENETEFWQKTVNYRKLAQDKGDSLIEYLKRIMLQQASINSPADVACFLASYARDAKHCLEKQADLPTLTNIKQALEEALDIKFSGEKGNNFFQSTLIQTLFYGIFSAWVLWYKENPNREDHFNWKEAAYYLHVPMIQSLFYQLSNPSQLRKMGLVEILDWTGSALNRVKRDEFFNKFNEGEAVQYFYEPFLEAFDPNLRKELGVWYTPPEIVKYMVARVDTVLKEELNIKDGLADDNVYILDPCCGTGAYLVEVLRHIANTLDEQGLGALAMNKVKEAAKNRVFGFEILTAPFVISHLQLGLVLANLGVLLQEETERVGVYLTNALTGWQPPNEDAKKRIQQLELTFPELNQEREAADEVKQDKPILVILGNPPYNAYAGTSPVEENGLVEIYKTGLINDWGIKKFNLDELYVRFFRLAERCISEQTGKGVVCYISNFSYLSDPSFVGMRQRFLQEFDRLYFDCMNGDSRETGKVTPDGTPDPSVFSTQYNKAGIRVGTAISLMVRKDQRNHKPVVNFRHFWGVNKNQAVLDSLNHSNFDSCYTVVNPNRDNRFSFHLSDIADHYLQWVKLTDLCAIEALQGLDEDRGFELIDIDKDKLITRMKAYFDNNIEWDALKLICKRLTQDSARFVAKEARKKVTEEEQFLQEKIMKCDLRQFDKKWCYYTAIRPLWKEPRPSLGEQLKLENSFLISRAGAIGKDEGKPMLFTHNIFLRECVKGKKAVGFPILVYPTSKTNTKTAQLFDTEEFITNTTTKANLSQKARHYLSQIEINNPDANKETAALIWYHALAIGYSPLYLTENADGIRQDFPRIPLPNSQKLLLNSAKLGEQIAQLLDTENLNPVGIIHELFLQKLKHIAVISHVENKQLNPDAGELAINVGWGHGGKEGVTMPGKGKIIERAYFQGELDSFQQGLNLTSEQVQELLGKVTCDVYLNNLAYWKNIPINVWEYTIGGYQVIKKWLSYREQKLLGRSLTVDEVLEVSNIAKRITAILLLEPELDANYVAIKSYTYDW